MKTNNNTPKTANNNVANTIASAAASGVGATAGIVAAELIAPAKAAAHTSQQSPLQSEPAHSETPTSGTHTIPGKPIASQPEPEVHVVEDNDDINVQPEDISVEVVGFETLEGETGEQVDLAVVAVDGQEIGLFDVDQDGTADIAAMDVNGDGTITEDEVENISECGISMDQMHNDFLAQNDPTLDGPDYINDGNVESYMA